MNQRIDHGLPVGKLQRIHVKIQHLEGVDVGALAFEFERHLVNGMVYVLFLDHLVQVHVAKQSQLGLMVRAHRLLATADQHVRYDADGAKNTDRLLGRLGLHFAGRLDERNQCQMDEQPVGAPDVVPELPDRLQEGKGFDVAHGPSDFRDRDVNVFSVKGTDGLLDLIGDVGNDLHGLSQIAAFPLLADHRAVNTPRGVVTVPVARDTRKALVVPEVQVRFRAIHRDIDLSVLVRRHGARVHVQIRVQFLHPNAISAAFEEQRQRC